MSNTRVIGVDVGGSGVKAALVDVKRGELASVRPRIDTPQPATPKLVAATVSRLVDQLGGEETAKEWLVSKGIDANLEIIDSEFDGILGNLAAGTCDVVASSLTITEERQAEVDFTEPYFAADQSLLVKVG